MANMFTPSALDQLVKDHAEDLRREADGYVPEWEALVDMLDEDHQQDFLDQHDGELSAIAVIADETEEPADAEVSPERLRGDK